MCSFPARLLLLPDARNGRGAARELGELPQRHRVAATEAQLPRGRALGMVMQLPERDKLSMSYEQMTSRLAIMMGGRMAEEIIFGSDKVTSGASSDISQATKLARAMVTK